LLHLALQLALYSLFFTSVCLVSCVSLLENRAILDSMSVLKAVSALERLESRANDLRVGIGGLSGKVSGIRLAGISANLAERLSTIGGGVIEVLVVELS
jgi:hypothetical protein